MDTATTGELGPTDGMADWRVLDGRAAAWFDAPTHAAGAALISRIAESVGEGTMPDADLRRQGLRISIGTPGAAGPTGDDLALARAVSAAAAGLGLAADPGVLQVARLTIEAAGRPAVSAFWQTALSYRPADGGVLRDPLRRDPSLRIHPQAEARLLRNRMHVDAVRPSDVVAAVLAAVDQQPHGAYGLTLADPEGNEIDLVPGDPLGPESSVADWRTLFAAMAFYPAASAAQSAEFAAAAADVADETGVPLMVDVRAEGVVIDSGKDQWEDDLYPGDGRFADLAARIQALARSAGLAADPTQGRFLQLGIDAVDVPAVRRFWADVLGYGLDPRDGVTDIVDPRRLAPVLIFQKMDPPQPDRLRQRDRIHLELLVPPDGVRGYLDRAVAAGGRVLSRDGGGCRLADPEGNELHLVTS